jgi:hypothetical protein
MNLASVFALPALPHEKSAFVLFTQPALLHQKSYPAVRYSKAIPSPKAFLYQQEDLKRAGLLMYKTVATINVSPSSISPFPEACDIIASNRSSLNP